MSEIEAFKLYGLTPSFSVDVEALTRKHQMMMRKFHPDLFADRSAAERRVAQQWSARFNEAFRVLKDPILRAQALCEAAGHPINAETNTAMNPMFLMEQMEAREYLDSVREDASALEALRVKSQADFDAHVLALGEAIDTRQAWDEAVEGVRRLMFERKFIDEIESIQAQRFE